MEERITFTSENHILEGLLDKRSGGKGAIITHPHPLYGGDMANPVVESLAISFAKKNFTTLRFNFRGTGNSEGAYGEGIAEGEDVLAAIKFLLEQGVTSIELAGYSFGSWVLAHMEQFPDVVKGMVFVAPPIGLLPFKGKRVLPLLNLVITGEDDEIAPASLIEKCLPEWNQSARFEVIDSTDHFYFGSFPVLEDIMYKYLTSK